MTNGKFLDVRVAADRLEQLARWWTSATQEARWDLYAKTIKGEAEAPKLRTLQLAIYLAETEAGEVGEG